MSNFGDDLADGKCYITLIKVSFFSFPVQSCPVPPSPGVHLSRRVRKNKPLPLYSLPPSLSISLLKARCSRILIALQQAGHSIHTAPKLTSLTFGRICGVVIDLSRVVGLWHRDMWRHTAATMASPPMHAYHLAQSRPTR